MILIPFLCFVLGGTIVYLYFLYKEKTPGKKEISDNLEPRGLFVYKPISVNEELLDAQKNLFEQQIEKMKCCANCKSFKGYGETCEGWGEPVLNLNCDCTEWELRR